MSRSTEPASDAPTVSVVLPVLDEQRRIGARLDELLRMPIHQVIVVDGGSRDDTVAIACRPGVTVTSAPAGRASQMNHGARVSTGEVLWFLHADVSPPPDATARIARALADPAVVAGAFRTRTVNDGPPSRLAALLPLADLRASYTGTPYGDQALFVRRSVFTALGGFPDQPLFEDLELSRRLRRAGELRIVDAHVRVSGRRFLARPLRTTVVMNTFPVLYRLGVPPARLAALYPPVR